MTKKERNFVKEKLYTWANYIDKLNSKKLELQKLQNLIKNMGDISAVSYNFMPKKDNKKHSYIEDTVIDSIEKCDLILKKINSDIDCILREKVEMDNIINTLTEIEKKVIIMRYVKNYEWNFIPQRVYISRTRCFDIHNSAFNKILEELIKTSNIFILK